MVNRWSTAGFVPPSVLSTNSTVRASEETFRTVVFGSWWARGTDVPWASRAVDIFSGPAMRRPAPTRPWYVRVLDSAGKKGIILRVCVLQNPPGIRRCVLSVVCSVKFVEIVADLCIIPGHALHEKSLQKQNGVGPLVSSQEERALLVPVINPGSTADFVPAFGLHRISLVRASGEAFRRRVFDALEGTRDPCLLGEQFCWHPVLPDPARPSAGRPDPNRPWYVRVLDSTSLLYCSCRIACLFPVKTSALQEIASKLPVKKIVHARLDNSPGLPGYASHAKY